MTSSDESASQCFGTGLSARGGKVAGSSGHAQDYFEHFGINGKHVTCPDLYNWVKQRAKGHHT